MAKRMSRTLAAEIADRAMAVVNPANRAMTLNASLQRHGFAPGSPPADRVTDRTALIAWLIETYAAND